MKHTITSILCGMCALLAVSCGSQDGTITDTQPTTDSITETEAVTEALLYPEYELDLGGEALHMIYFDAVAVCGWSSSIPSDINAAEQTGDALADAIYLRNRKVEDLYNFHITSTAYEQWDIQALVNKSVMAGAGDYDAVFPQWQVMGTLITQDSLLQLDDLIDVSQPWWDEKALEGFSVLGKTYAMSGDILFVDKFSDIIIMFNKQMADNYDLGDIYSLVVDKQWTFDILKEMSRTVSADLDANGKYDKNDRFGFSGQNDGLYELFNSSGEKFCDIDGDGVPYLSCESERAVDIFTRVYEFMNDTQHYFNRQSANISVADTAAMFKQDQVLFLMRPLSTLFDLRSMEADFGIIPTPLMDESQTEYYTSIGYTVAPAVCIPKDAKNAEATAAVLDTLSAESHYNVNPMLYDLILGAKVTRDDQSTENLDIIFSSHVYDPGEIFGFGKLANDMMSSWKNMETKVVSTIEKKKKAVEISIEKLLEAINAQE